MATLNLNAPGASHDELSRGLIAAADVLRSSGLAVEFVEAGRASVAAHHAGTHRLHEISWHWRAAQVFADAQEAALAACYGTNARAAGCELLIVTSHVRDSFLD